MTDPQVAIAYHVAQTQRISQMESSRAVMSAAVIGSSLIALALSTAAPLALGVAAVNLAACWYVKVIGGWVRHHRDRAAAGLVVASTGLVAAQREADSTGRPAVKKYVPMWAMHGAVVVACVWSAVEGAWPA